jgi:hypothetical protein
MPTLICKQVHCHEIRELWIRAGRHDSLKKPDLCLENKLRANTIFVLVHAFLFMYVHFVRSSPNSFSFVFLF